MSDAMPRSALLELALLFCPRAFRREYRAQIYADTAASGRLGAAALDVARYGITARAEGFARDVVLALRSLAKAPTFTAVALLTLALAISVNAAVFAVIHTVLFKPLPFTEPDQLVLLCRGAPRNCGQMRNGVIGAFARESTTLAGVGALQFDGATLTGHGLPQVLTALDVSTGAFGVLGVRPQLGRLFVPADGAPGNHNVVISDQLWRHVLGGDPHVTDKNLVLDGTAWRIVGVAPPDTVMPVPTDEPGTVDVDLWRTLPNASFRAFELNDWAFARIRPGATRAAVDDDVARVTASVVRAHPVEQHDLHVAAVPVSAWYRRDERLFLELTLATVFAVLLIACANVANLLLVRSLARRGDLALRSALGATRARIVHELLAEIGVIACAGGALGLAIAFVDLRGLAALDLPSLPGIAGAHLDGAAVAFTFGVVVVATVLAGVLPAAFGTRIDLTGAMKGTGRGGDGTRVKALRSGLAIVEIALAFAVVTASGLFVRSSAALASAPLGVDPRGVYLAGLSLSGPRYESADARAAAADAIVARVRSLPGVDAVAVARPAQFSFNGTSGGGFHLPGRTYTAANEPDISYTQVGPDFFRALRIPLLRGRAFNAGDQARTARVAIVDERLAREYFPGADPVGARILVYEPDAAVPGPVSATIVGLVRSATPRRIPERPRLYVPNAQAPATVPELVVRLNAPDPELRAHVAEALAAVDPNLALVSFASVEERAGAATARSQTNAALLGILALVALLLALGGIYGVVSYSVERRRHEFGIRMAVGARGSDILRSVLGGAARIALIGTAGGLVLSAIGTRSLEDVLYAVSSFDPLTLCAVGALVFACVVAAAAVPAMRAMHVDPAVALRSE
jgi:predicted permease